MDYFVRKVELETGEQIPFVFCKEPAQPILLGNMFLVTWLRSQVSQNTMIDAARLIKYLYHWADMTGTNLEGRLMAGQMLNITEIVGFMTWLANKRSDAPIVGSIGTQCDGVNDDRGDYDDGCLSPKRFNTYKDEFHAFLKWAIQTFVGKANPDAAVAVDTLFKDMVEKLKAVFKRITKRGKSVRRGKGLTKAQRQRLLDVARPGSPQNPFRQEIQLRNYLIVLVFLYTGMRRGELCSLWVEDAPTKANGYVVHIKRRPDDPRDMRKRKPKIKGRSREILLTENIVQLIQDYIKKHRWSVIVRDETGKVIKREKPDHDYLFCASMGGAPLSMDSVNEVIATLADVCFPEGDVELHCHILRNTFCNENMEEAVDVKGQSLDEAMKNLRRLCGWKETSEMPLLYAQKWLDEKANSVNLSRLEREYEEDDGD